MNRPPRPAAKPTPVREADFRRQVVGPKGLATMLGWLHVGFRPAQTAHGWRTPITGELGAGWPDLVLLHVAKRRLLFRELKGATGEVSAEQRAVIALFQEAGFDAAVWRPADLDSGRIASELAA